VSRRPGPPRACSYCGETRRHEAHGWCNRCYERWRRAGKPASGPAPPRHRAGRKPGPLADRIAEWEFFRGLGYGEPQIAARLGLSVRTLQRYAGRDRATMAA
jgi:hypothetical protein